MIGSRWLRVAAKGGLPGWLRRGVYRPGDAEQAVRSIGQDRQSRGQRFGLMLMRKGIVYDEKKSTPSTIVCIVSLVTTTVITGVDNLTSRDATSVGTLTRTTVDYGNGIDRIH